MAGLQEKRGRSIQSRLILLLLLILIPVLTIQAFSYYDSYRIRRASALQANLEIARAVAKAFESFIQDILHQELAIGLAITSSQPMTSKDINRILKASRDYAAIRDFTWMNANGVAVYSSNSAMIGINYSDRSYFRTVAGGREWMVSELITAKTTGEPVFGISRGIRDDRGTLLGIIFAAIIPEKLDARLAVQRGKGAGFAIVDNKGMLVYRYPAIAATWEERNWLKLHPRIETILKGEEVADGAVAAPYDEGRMRLSAATPVPSIGWAVTAATREEDVTGPIISSISQSALLFLFVALAAFLIAFAFSRKITGPVTALRAHALALGQGETPEPVKINHVREFQDLAEAVNRMAEKVWAREADLRESEERFRTIAETLPALISLSRSEDSTIVFTNKAFNEVLGFRKEEIIGRKGPDVYFYPADREKMIDALKEQGFVNNYQLKIKRSDGRPLWLLSSVQTIIFAGKPAILAASIDITERKRAEDALEERTQQLEDANDELESFTYSVSHDLKAPLRAVDGYSRMLLKKYGTELSADAVRMLTVIRSSTERINVLIDDLLSFSRILRNRLSPAEIDMDKLVSEVWDEIRAEHQQRELELKIKELRPGFGDRALIKQVLFNILSNAVKFTKNRKPGIIEISSCTEPGRVVYCLRDNGIGFDMAYYDNLFGVFKRLHGHEEYEGTGVGLAIVQRIIHRHGGQVWAEGQVDKGATFYFTLPGELSKLSERR
ncbi:MAG: ATP-binding protein [Syntrophales bacterium]|nr:ATP-binding protein [Syntrophales bacterium]